MNEQEFGRNLAAHLNRGLTHINRETLSRLGQARESALGAYREPGKVFGLAWSGNNGLPLLDAEEERKGRYGYLLPTLLLLATLAFAFSWQSGPVSDEFGDVADIDARLLGGDLPIQAYLDTSMDSWLDDSSE